VPFPPQRGASPADARAARPLLAATPKEVATFAESEPCDPAVRAAAVKMARRFVWIIQAIMREEERLDAL
jgi:hypothetical protein